MVNQLAAAFGMGVYVMAVLYATKLPYTMMVNRGMEHIRAVYYNRKIVHMLAGGVGSLSVPFLFTDVWYPMVSGILLTGLLYASHREHGHLDSVTIKVGGNPAEPDEAWSYMAPFSPHDVIAEYTRPARVVREGTMTAVPAMDDLHTIDASGRTMEAFLTDGLRSLTSIPATSMGEYTVRWPGHIQRYQSTNLNPDELVEAWRYDPNRPEFTWMEVAIEVEGKRIVWTVEDGGKDGDSSMARTTGLVTAACVMAWCATELFTEGIHPPEDLPTEVIHDVIHRLKEAGVSVLSSG